MVIITILLIMISMIIKIRVITMIIDHHNIINTIINITWSRWCNYQSNHLHDLRIRGVPRENYIVYTSYGTRRVPAGRSPCPVARVCCYTAYGARRASAAPVGRVAISALVYSIITTYTAYRRLAPGQIAERRGNRIPFDLYISYKASLSLYTCN